MAHLHAPPATLASPAASSSRAAVESKVQLPASCDPPGLTRPPKQRVWVIFGCSGHIGRSVLKTALNHGDIVAGVGKLHEDTVASMAALVGAPAEMASPPGTTSSSDPPPPPATKAAHAHPHPRYLPLVCDVRLVPSVTAVFEAALERWGRYDIVANCSGYGVVGACEDQDDADIRGQLETNFFGTWHIIQASLPYFRTRGGAGEGAGEDSSEESDASEDEAEDSYGDERSSGATTTTGTGAERRPRGGRYLIFSSTSGALGVPGLGPFCATKYAVEGLIESLLYEVDPFGIRATLVEPGHVRRDDSTGEGTPPLSTPSSAPSGTPPGSGSGGVNGRPATAALPRFGHFFLKAPSAPYATHTSPAAHVRRVMQWLGDHQPTSVVKAAELIWQLGHCRYPPLRLLLGTYAVESVRDRLRTIIEEIEDWKFLNFGAQGGPSAEARDRDAKMGEEEEEGEEDEDEDLAGDAALEDEEGAMEDSDEMEPEPEPEDMDMRDADG